jgi:hypothetical protein
MSFPLLNVVKVGSVVPESKEKEMTVEFKGMTRDEVDETIKVGDFVFVKGGSFCAPSVDGGADIKHMSIAKVLPENGVEERTKTGFWITQGAVNINCIQSMPHKFMKVANGGVVVDKPTGLVGEITSEQTVRIDRDNAISTRIDNWITKRDVDTGSLKSNNETVIAPFTIKVNPDSKGLIVPMGTSDDEVQKILGVFRPNLEDRKVGKVRVELVDDGFPLALRYLAKLMTWAQTAKGYKDHDWLNIPGGAPTLAAATSRHRTDRIIQIVDGCTEMECVDPESGLLHKAHELFGVMGQLEIILREGEKNKQ